MAGALKKTLYLLGLADEEEYESYDDQRDQPEQVEPRRRAEVTPLRSVSSAPVVREAAMGSLNRITTIHPRSYNEARHIGEAFREGTPVIMNLTEMDEVEAKRLVDFAAGLAFGLHGSLERVTAKVFLITPESVEVEGGAPEGQPVLFNQS